MKQIILQKFITREDIQINKHWLYIFGDNDKRVGKGGQAKEMRGEPNSIGIRVKKTSGTKEEAYYTDVEALKNIENITQDFKIIEEHLMNGGIVVIPIDGIGTGLAKLKDIAPITLQFVKGMIKELIKRYGLKETK